MRHDELAHYGVKGMKWGVRRQYNKLSRLNSKATKYHALSSAANTLHGTTGSVGDYEAIGAKNGRGYANGYHLINSKAIKYSAKAGRYEAKLRSKERFSEAELAENASRAYDKTMAMLKRKNYDSPNSLTKMIRAENFKQNVKIGSLFVASVASRVGGMYLYGKAVEAGIIPGMNEAPAAKETALNAAKTPIASIGRTADASKNPVPSLSEFHNPGLVPQHDPDDYWAHNASSFTQRWRKS